MFNSSAAPSSVSSRPLTVPRTLHAFLSETYSSGNGICPRINRSGYRIRATPPRPCVSHVTDRTREHCQEEKCTSLNANDRHLETMRTTALYPKRKSTSTLNLYTPRVFASTVVNDLLRSQFSDVSNFHETFCTAEVAKVLGTYQTTRANLCPGSV
jgi:hypothetical protein